MGRLQPTKKLLGWAKPKWDEVCKSLCIDFNIENAFNQFDETQRNALMMPVYGVKKRTGHDYVKQAIGIYGEWLKKGNPL